MSASNSDVVVLAAHPDDETLGCGGTIALLADRGLSVSVFCMTDGVAARGLKVGDITARDAAYKKAVALLGGRYAGGWGKWIEDNESDKNSMLELAKCASTIIESYKPRLVLTHSSADLNIDHRRAHEAALVACRPRPGFVAPDILAFEVPSSTEVGLRRFSPTVFYDIGKWISVKTSALACYQTELHAPPFARSIANVEALARIRGSEIGAFYAEAFEPVRLVRGVGRVFVE